MSVPDEVGMESFFNTIHNASANNARGGIFEVYTYARREFLNYERQIWSKLMTARPFQQLHFRESWLLRDDAGASITSINDAGRIIRAVFETLNNREGDLRQTFLPSQDDYTLVPDKKVLKLFFEATAMLENASKLGQVDFLRQQTEGGQGQLSKELLQAARAARISSLSIDASFPLALLQAFSDNGNVRKVEIEISDGDNMLVERNVSVLSACKDKHFDVHAAIEINAWVIETWRQYVKCINDAKESIKILQFTTPTENFPAVWNNDEAASILVNNLEFVADQKVILNSDLPIGEESSTIIDGIVATNGILVIAAEHEGSIPSVLKRSLLSESCKVESLTVEGLADKIDNTFFICEHSASSSSVRTMQLQRTFAIRNGKS